MKEFKAYFCHHKGGGCLLARFVKLGMQRSTNAKISINESGNLEDMGVLLGTIRAKVENQLVLFTRAMSATLWSRRLGASASSCVRCCSSGCFKGLQQSSSLEE